MLRLVKHLLTQGCKFKWFWNHYHKFCFLSRPIILWMVWSLKCNVSLLLFPCANSALGGWFTGTTFVTSWYTHGLASFFLEGCNELQKFEIVSRNTRCKARVTEAHVVTFFKGKQNREKERRNLGSEEAWRKGELKKKRFSKENISTMTQKDTKKGTI